MNKGTHRVAAGTKSARKLAAANYTPPQPAWPFGKKTQQQLDIEAWNAEVERKKAAKKHQP